MAFIAADVDNQNSAGISAYERGCSMKNAAANMFESQLALAEAIRERPATVSTLIRLADWPVELLDAFPSPLTIPKVDAERSGPVLEDPDRRELLLAGAESLAMQQRDRRDAGSRPMSRAGIARQLSEASRSRSGDDRLGLSHRLLSAPDGREFLKLSIPLPFNDKAALLAKIEAQLDLASSNWLTDLYWPDVVNDSFTAVIAACSPTSCE